MADRLCGGAETHLSPVALLIAASVHVLARPRSLFLLLHVD